MMQIVLIGIAAGAASALLFSSLASGSLFSIFLFYLAPLPILIVSIGWTHWAGLIAALGASLVLGTIFGELFVFAFLLAVALPAWWLGYLAMLARPMPDGTLEWYPSGRLVLWAAGLGALAVVAAMPQFGTDEQSFRAGLQSGFERVLRAQSNMPAGSPLALPGMKDPARMMDILVLVIPATAAVITTLTHMINLWLAGRIVRFSKLLKRPWPDLPSLEFPQLAVVALFGALGISMLGGLVGIAAGVVAATLIVAFGILGFAVLHSITQGMESRAFVLSGAYAAVLIFGWPLLAMAVLGLSENFLQLRARFAHRRSSRT